MKRLLIVTMVTVLLVSCGGGKKSRGVTCEKDYWNGTYGTCLPAGWVSVDPTTLKQRGVPADVIAAFQAETSVSGFFPAVTVTRERLGQVADPVAYSEASIRSVSVLPAYELLDKKKATIDGEDVSLHIFTAQPIAEEPLRRFYQISTAVDTTGYTVTGTGPVAISDDLAAEIQLILKESTLKEPVEE